MMMKVFGLVAACTTSGALALKENNVYFQNSGSINYQLDSYSISSRRRSTWGGVVNEFDHINFETSKIKDKHSAQSDFFTEGLGPVNIMGSNANSQYPSRLLFAVKGDLTLNVGGVTVTCPDIRLGRATKWWLAGSNCLGGNKGKNPVTCTCHDGARVKFESKSSKKNNKFKVSLDSPCGLITERTGSWQAVTAMPGQKITWTYASSESTFTEEDFKLSLTAKYSKKFVFGALDMSTEASMSFVSQTTQSSSYTQTCEVTVPSDMRLWQWVYSVTNGCGTSSMNLCYFFVLPITDSKPCCLVGYQSNVSNVCTDSGKNMCDGTRRLATERLAAPVLV